MLPITFPIGYHSLYPDVSMNFQMNRWYGWVGEPAMLDEMRIAAPRIATYLDWKREFVTLAERPAQQGLILRAGFYWRSVYGAELGERHTVPYADGRHRGFLPAYRLQPPHAKCTIVLFGGFDSYVEELTSAFVFLRDAGYDVIAFDGPGQGGALEEAGMPMTAEWHKPIGAVLDYFGVDRVVLAGLSLGGCLVMRAAAAEPRVAHLIAFDALTNLLECNLLQTDPLLRGMHENNAEARGGEDCKLDGRPGFPQKPGRAVGHATRHACDRYRVGIQLSSKIHAVPYRRYLRVDSTGCPADGGQRRPLRAGASIPVTDRHPHERTFDYRTLVYPKRECAEPLPSG